MYAITYKANGLPIVLSGLSVDGISETLDFIESNIISDMYKVTDISVTGDQLPGRFSGTAHAWRQIASTYSLR